MYQFLFLIVNRTTVLSVLLLLGVLTSVEGQNVLTIDSLKNELQHADDKQRYEIEFKLFTEYFSSDSEKAFEHVSNALIQAQKNGDTIAIIYSANAKGIYLRQHGDFTDAIDLFELALADGKACKGCKDGDDTVKSARFVLHSYRSLR